MTPLQRALASAVQIACLVVAAGLVARRRWTLSGFFAAYIAFGLVVNPMIVWWPAQFYRQWFVLVVQTTLDVLKFGIAIEAGWRTFRPFPGARSSALLMTLVIMAATALAAAAVPIGGDAWEWEVVVGQFFPRVKTGTIWLMAVTLVLAHWYHVPVHPFHAAILTSFVAYLAVESALLSLWDGGKTYVAHASLLDAIDLGAYVVLACYWARTAWRPESAKAIAHRETLRKLETSAALPGNAL